MARIGYSHFSTLDQDHATQEARLHAAGCKIVRSEKVSGKNRQDRDELAWIIEFMVSAPRNLIGGIERPCECGSRRRDRRAP